MYLDTLNKKLILALKLWWWIVFHRLKEHLHLNLSSRRNPPRIRPYTVLFGSCRLDFECNRFSVVYVFDAQDLLYNGVERATELEIPVWVECKERGCHFELVWI